MFEDAAGRAVTAIQIAKPPRLASITIRQEPTAGGRWRAGAVSIAMLEPDAGAAIAVVQLDHRHRQYPEGGVGILPQASPHQDRGSVPALLRGQGPTNPARSVENGGQRIAHRSAIESAAAAQHLEQHDAKRPVVRPFVHDAVPAPARATCTRRCRE